MDVDPREGRGARKTFKKQSPNAMGSDHASQTDGGARSPEGQLDYDLTSTLLVTVYLLKSSTIQEISVCRPQQATL